MTWITILSVGVLYQEVYVDKNSVMVGAVTKLKGQTQYIAFFSNGKIKRSVKRGSFRTAREWVDGQYLHNPL